MPAVRGRAATHRAFPRRAQRLAHRAFPHSAPAPKRSDVQKYPPPGTRFRQMLRFAAGGASAGGRAREGERDPASAGARPGDGPAFFSPPVDPPTGNNGETLM